MFFRITMDDDIYGSFVNEEESEVCESCGEDLVNGMCENPNCEKSGLVEDDEEETDDGEKEIDEFEME